MNIRLKVTALVACLFVILGAAEILVDERVLTPSFTELEHADARIAMRRINYALESNLASLRLSATDWGNWADTYRFVVDHNADYIADNVTAVGLRQLNVNALVIVDAAGRIVQASELELVTGQPLHIDLLARKALPSDFPWRAGLTAGQPVDGLLQTNRGILMLAGAPILDGSGHGPSRGMVMLGRLLSNDEISRIGAQAQAQLTMLARPTDTGGDRLVEVGNLTQVYHSFADLYGRPIMTLRVDVPREISMRGRRAIAYASTYLAGAAVVVLLLLVIVLNRVVLTPLARITRHAVAIGEGKDLTGRLALASRDEIGVLAREFDSMVGRLDDTRRQLVDQSFQAGLAELAKGVLHNLGNAMTPIGVRVTRLRERLREAPCDDAHQALDELKRHTADQDRRADLEEFVRLACGELIVAVRGAQEDLEIMSRQTAIVQSALSEQMRATRNEHVIEAVRLPELVSQSVEIVPDACRTRLFVDTEPSLQEVGVVEVARTVLRLVLQNVIINAADAVREAGKARGVLHIGAQLVGEQGRPHLHLQCRDNGVGIAPENLQRVFERGFSTKSKETNYGIGLHWCSNAIAALGGRIWASSEGPGLGASMHILVPLGGTEVTSPAAAA